MKVLFLGTPLFAQIVLDYIIKSNHEVVGVICQPDKPSGRGMKFVSPEIKHFAEENGIKVYQFEKVRKSIEEIKAIDYDIALTASYGQILPQTFLDIKPCINVHPSLLPKYRGATPIQTALLNGDTETGVTIMRTEAGVDCGDIILQEKVQISQDIYYNEFMIELAHIGGKMAVKALDLIESGKDEWVKQDHNKATFVKMIEKTDGYLDFSKNSDEIVNKVRAFGDLISCYITIGGENIKVYKAQKVDYELSKNEKDILCVRKRFIIQCKDGAVEILRCQAPNGKILDARDFLNGYKFKSDRVE